MAAVKTVGIAGITGRLAGLVATALLANSPAVAIRGLARDPSKLAPALASSPRVTIVKGAADDGAAVRDFARGCDVVLCTYMGDDAAMLAGQLLLVDACEELGVARYFASEWSLDSTQLALGQMPIKDACVRVRQHLESKRRVRGVYVVNGGFMETVVAPMFGVYDGRGRTFAYWGEGTEPWEATSVQTATEYTAAAALDPSAVGVQRFLGSRKSIKEIAEAFEKVYGVKPALERRGSMDEYGRYGDALAAKLPEALLQYFTASLGYFWLSGKAHVGTALDNDKYPAVKAESWEDFFSARPLEAL